MKKSWAKRTILSKNFWLSRPEEFGQAYDRSVTVLIPAYNEEKSIEKTVRSVKNQSFFVNRIIVIDDFSTDKTGEIAKKAGAEVIRAEKNSGTKAQALNLAIPYIDTEIVICVDADTELKEDAIEKIIPYFNDEQTGIVCGFVTPKKSSSLWERGRLLEYLCACSINKEAQERVNAVMIASGCFMAMPTQLLIDMGGYDDRTMAEDMDLTWRCIDAGYLIRFARQAECYVVDPHNFDIYQKQVSRWTRGFLQNIKVRNFNLFKNSKKLGFVVWFYFLMALLGPIMLPVAIYAMITGSALAFFGWMMVIYTCVVWIPGLIEGHKKGYSVAKILTCIPCQLVTQYVNMYIFVKSLVQEIVLNQTLKTWNKGH